MVSASCCVERLAVGFALSAAAVAELDVATEEVPVADPVAAEAAFEKSGIVSTAIAVSDKHLKRSQLM